MYNLGIETSTDMGSVALLSEDSVLGFISFGRRAVHARDIMVHIDGMLGEAGVDRNDLGLVSVSVGPGSFTGLRVGVTCAKTLAYALGLDAAAVCSLEVMAAAFEPDNVPCSIICPIRDARRGAVYARVFEKGTDGWASRDGVIIDDPHRLAGTLPEGAMVFGSGVEAYPEIFATPRFRHPADDLNFCEKGAVSAARIGFRHVKAGRCVTPMELLPRYYRLTEIEERLARRNHCGDSNPT